MKKSLFFSFSFIGTIGLAVTIPLVALALLGRYLDKIYGTSPTILIVMIVLSMVIVYFSIKKIVADTIEKFKNID